MKIGSYLVLLLAISAVNCELNRDEIKVKLGRLAEALENGEDFHVHNAMRELSLSFPDEDLKVIGLDWNSLTLKIGTMHYYVGNMVDITAIPYWPTFNQYNHILHEADSGPEGIMYLTSDNTFEHAKGKPTFARSLTVNKAPNTMTPVYVVGSGDIKVDANQDGCDNLARDEVEILKELNEIMDRRVVVLLTSEYYCPSKAELIFGELYRGHLNTLKGETRDGDAVNYYTADLGHKSSKLDEVKKSNDKSSIKLKAGSLLSNVPGFHQRQDL